MTAWAEPHDCVFPEAEITEDDVDGVLESGMRVLLPCSICGEAPLDHLGVIEDEWERIGKTIVMLNSHIPLFHWAPTTRRKQIIRYGLRPRMRATTSGYHGSPVICLADSPSWAWALSGGMRYTPSGSWDLWQTSMDRLEDPKVLATTDRRSGIYEVRTLSRVFKSDVWYVATREKP